jgi:signal transduction histidine kinase
MAMVVGWLSLTQFQELRAEGARDRDPNAPLAIHSLVVDGAPVVLRPQAKLRLSPQPRSVTIGFGPATNSTQPPMRIRYKLDGYDDGWRETDGSMRLCVRFLDGTGDQVSETVFAIAGQSAGWTGNPATATFTRRQEEILVPPRATGFWVVMSSAGPPATVGVFVITNLMVTTHPSGGGPSKVALPWAFGAGARGMTAGGAPAGWMRDGLRPSMASLLEGGSASGNKGFVIKDDDARGHAEWHTIKEEATAVTPGDCLVVEWHEAYSFGLTAPVQVTYPDLPAGYYRFRIQQLSVLGTPGEAETSLAFEVPLAFWRTPWFWVSVLAVALMASLGGWRYVSGRRLRLRLQHLEQQRAVDRERLRIAQDIHDDLGARVTEISLLSAVAEGKPSLPAEARADFGTVSRMTRELVSALYETVWAVNPENDNLDALANYLCQMANQLCAQTRLRCRFEVPDALPVIPLSSQVRHHLILAVKEALHNVIKHARASEVRLRIAFEGSVLSISIQDDGCGFDPSVCPPGNGLGNLKHRLEGIGGCVTFASRLGAGTTVALRLPVAGIAADAS